MNIHGVERLTGDIDLILETSRSNLERFWDLLAGVGFQCRIPIAREQFADSKAWRDWTRSKGAKVITFFDPKDPLRQVDVMIATSVSYDVAKPRGTVIPLGGEPVPVVGVEDLIRMKRKAGRPKDALDVAALERLVSKPTGVRKRKGRK